MITYENTILGHTYLYFYDRSIRSWTVIEVDFWLNQIGTANHYANKKMMLIDYAFDFKNFYY